MGKSAIVLRLYEFDHARVGRYFYRSQGVDIGLVQAGKPGQFVECPLDGGNDEPKTCDAPTGYWTLSIEGDVVKGNWRKTATAAQTLPVELKRAAVTCDVHFDAHSDSERAYECLRSEAPTQVMARNGHSDDGAIAWQFVREKRSGAMMVQLSAAPDRGAMDAVNASLERGFREDISEALASLPGGSTSCDSKVSFANARFFTVDETCGWDWPGAAHPSSSWHSTTYDLKTGKALDWSRIFRFPPADTKTFDYAKGDDLVSMVLRKASQESGGSEDSCLTQGLASYECKGTQCTNWAHYGDKTWAGMLELAPRKEGLFAALSYSEADRPCRGEGVTLPWKDVRKAMVAPVGMP
ncbi:hypothetical protein D7S89_07805 [Trinickia fusca]|uniref:Uncharacterized protein n=1 Tax=Trinickia fusca TaxID=2419777 RepID=A0A494XMI1_9BURK|nr:hypothetical protein D7S89_07805 [Trinickia fusca]